MSTLRARLLLLESCPARHQLSRRYCAVTRPPVARGHSTFTPAALLEGNFKSTTTQFNSKFAAQLGQSNQANSVTKRERGLGSGRVQDTGLHSSITAQILLTYSQHGLCAGKHLSKCVHRDKTVFTFIALFLQTCKGTQTEIVDIHHSHQC